MSDNDTTDAGEDTAGDRSDDRGQGGQSGRGRDRDRDRDRGRRSGPREAGDGPSVGVDEVRDAAVQFTEGLVAAFGLTDCRVEATVSGNEIDVQVHGANLGLLVGPAGQTLLAIQDLLRVAAQRRLGDHDTRLRLDVGGYREKRREALERFAHKVADEVESSGQSRSLEPMPSADRKVIHDALTERGGVRSSSEGDDPNRRVVVHPADNA